MRLATLLRLLRSPLRTCRIALVLGAAALGQSLGGGPRGRALRAQWNTGISVLIPERGTPDLLRRALEHLMAALARITEPWEVVVIVNGEPPHTYDGLRRQFRGVRWSFHDEPLGFSGALDQGLRLVNFGGVYLHNSDIALDPRAIETLLPWRASHVFAIASQIFFDDQDRRREETGWGDCDLRDDRTDLFDRNPDADGLVRGGLYAGGGASLFDATLLKRFSGATRGYAPFYWEDVDWGVQAWRHGLEVLFHPGSIAWHRHRATIARFFPPAEIDRVVERNRLLFELRNLPLSRPGLRRAAWVGGKTMAELAGWPTLREVAAARASSRRAAFAAVDLALATGRRYVRPAPGARRPLVLVVSPYCILPPRHGGAWRTWRLCEALSDRWRFVLLSDEAMSYSAFDATQASPFESVHLVGGRPDSGPDRIARIRAHSHAALQRELDRLIGVYRPDIVQIEHVELSGLRVPSAQPSLIVAHDVLLTDGDVCPDDAVERTHLASFGAVVVCSGEDAALLAPLRATVVPNGAVVDGCCGPSTGRRNLLFAGPFRYAPNLDGIRAFLAGVYPELHRRYPDLALTILAGSGGRHLAAGDALFAQTGVSVTDAVDDVRPWLDGCALTLNPLSSTRGSSIKVIESLAAGRMCVTTRDGARGWLDAGLDGLCVVDEVADMLEAIAQLLENEPSRLVRERPCPQALERFSWRSAAAVQEGIYQRLLPGAECLP